MTNNKHRSGFVSIIGRPNVGKSTLINSLMKEKLSIITSKAQTTRHRIRGIINGDDYQIVLSDTPGILDPSYKLQEAMMKFIKETLIDSDFLVIVEEVGNKESFDGSLIQKLNSFKIPIILLINKIDLSTQEELEDSIAYWKSIFPDIDIYPVSAIEGFFVDELIEIFKEKLPLSPPFFPKDQFTDRPERFFVNESIREQILIHYDKEVPYSVEVITEDFKESSKIIKIRSLNHQEIYLIHPSPPPKNKSDSNLDQRVIEEIHKNYKQKLQNPYHKIKIGNSKTIPIASIRSLKKKLFFSKSDENWSVVVISDAE